MVVDFKRTVNFFGKTYRVGVNEVPPDVQKHPYFQMLLKEGLVLEVVGRVAPKQEPVAEEPAKKSKKG
jgi:hypothetical protein